MPASAPLTTLLGRLDGPPVVLSTSSGPVLCRWKLESFEGWGGGTQHAVVARGALARSCSDALRDGATVLVEGTQRTHVWTDPRGERRVIDEVHAVDVVLLDAWTGEQAPASADTASAS